ncbi:class I SAM-dependent methyltransferase, partial [Stenotrophomonas maltophilia]|uniref:class I SAM-dependent methyltransferase n=1 Tax=Stenotrophomonas maltophilia TaxID=40324 RepID=UPI0013D91C89
PGLLAISFGYSAGEALGLDPEPNMLAAAREAAQGLTPNVHFRQADFYDLGPELGLFRLVAAGGAVVPFDDSHGDV